MSMMHSRTDSAKPWISVVIPAHNEERYVARCIRSIRKAADVYGGNVEIIVVCNRCTDTTEAIAKANGARVVHDETRCIASVRNAGTFLKAAFGNTEGVDKLLDELFYDYNDKH